MPVLPTYTQFGGPHPETAALANVLAARQIVAPRTGRPFSEAMILGIGGGLGIGYILWEFGEHRGQRNARVLALAFQHSWQYVDRYYDALCRRLRLRYEMPSTGSARVAARTLDEALARGLPVVAWVDGASLPYLQLPEPTKGHYGHVVAVCGTDGADILVDDCAVRPFPVPAETFAEARARIPSFRNRLLLVEDRADDLDLDAAVTEGIAVCVAHLGSDSDSFSLPATRKWARLMTDERHAKGWPVVFRDRRGLYSALTSIFEAINTLGAPGGLRGLYGAFLREAADLLGRPALREPADRYAALGIEWDRLAEDALPDTVPQFARTKRALRARHEVRLQGGDTWRSTQPITEELAAIRSECDASFPLDDHQVSELFGRLQARLTTIHAAEVEAVGSLKDALAAAR